MAFMLLSGRQCSRRLRDILGFNGVCASSGRQRFRRQRDACGDFINLEDFAAQSLKILIEVGFACVVGVVLCNFKETISQIV